MQGEQAMECIVERLRKPLEKMNFGLLKQIVFVFLVVLAPLFALSVHAANWGALAVREEIVKSSRAQMEYYFHNVENEIERLRILQYACLSDEQLNRLAFQHSVMSHYEMVRDMQLLRNRLQTIAYSSRYVADVTAYIFPLGRSVSVEEGVNPIDLGVRVRSEQALQLGGAQIYREGERLYLFSLMPGSEQALESGFLIEIALDVRAFQEDMEQFNIYPDSASLLEDSRSGAVYAAAARTKAVPEAAQAGGAYTRQSGESYTEPGGEPYTERSGKPYTVKNGEFYAMQSGEPYIRQDRQPELSDRDDYVEIFADSTYLSMRLLRYLPSSSVFAYMGTYKSWMLALVLLLCVVIVTFTLFINRYINRPIQKLVAVFREVEKGKLSVHLDEKEVKFTEFAYLYKRFNKMAERLDTLIDQVYRQSMLMQKAELKQLQAQIKPHFLYNSFFIISTMARMEDENLEAFANHLGEYYQYLTRNARELVPLSEEINHARTYTSIQAMRFSKSLALDFGDCPEVWLSFPVPRLMLQPLIENAFAYSVEKKAKNREIRISFEAYPRAVYTGEADTEAAHTGETDAETAHSGEAHFRELHIAVEDNGESITQERLSALRRYMEESPDSDREVTALLNIHRRLRLNYGDRSGIWLSMSPLGGLKAEIVICTEKIVELHIQ